MKCCSLIPIIFLTIIKTGRTTKWLIDNPGFDDPAAWIDEYLPCAREQVIFPEQFQALLPMPAKVDVGGFVLPKDGAIVLPLEATITLDGDSRERDCDNGKALLKEPTVHKWFDPKTWRSTKEVSSNKAIPDMEMVPCNNESVVIQAKGPLAFDLENVPYLRMGQLSFWGSLLSKNYLRKLLYDDLGQYLFRNQVGVHVEYYHHDVCGCHRDFNNFAEPICHNIIDTCERPHCLSPVVPYGSCCAICGTVLKFQVDDCGNKNLHVLENIITKSIKEKDLGDDLDHYVNYVSSQNYGNYLQAVVVDKDSYTEKSVRFVKELNDTTKWTEHLHLQQDQLIMALNFSGRPYNPNVTFGSVLLIFLCFVFVSIVALVIFAHYHPDSQYLRRVPRWTYDPRLWRTLFTRSNTVFARFDNTRASVMTTAAGQSAGFTMGYDAESGNVREERAFDNPMFGGKAVAPSTSKGKQSGVTKEDVEITESTKEVPQLLMESLDMDDDTNGKGERSLEEDQELTEIKLESSSDEEDDDDDDEKVI